MSNLSLGGAQKSLISILSLLDYNKYEVDLLLFQGGGSLISQVPNKVNIIYLDSESMLYFKSKREIVLNNLKKRRISPVVDVLVAYIKRILKISKRHGSQFQWESIHKYIKKFPKKYDVAIGYLQSSPVYYVVEKVDADKKLAWFHSDYKAGSYNSSIDKKYFEQVDKVVTVSEGALKVLREVFYDMPKKFIVINNIIPYSEMKKMSEDGNGFGKNNNDNLKILSIGRVDDVKGYDLQIEVSKNLVDKGYNFRWYVIGSGGKMDYYTKLVKRYNLQEHFIFLGSKINPYPYLKNCDIYVQTSRYESFCIAVAEAKFFNRCIISTNFTGIAEQLINEETGLIVNIDANEIYQGVKRLIDDNKLRNRISQNLSMIDFNNQNQAIMKKIYQLLDNRPS